MGLKIGHASIDENGKVKGGKQGDQTKKEVCIREWYSKPWDLMLRCKDPLKAELMAIACEKACTNDNIGYDQNRRNSLKMETMKAGMDIAKIKTPCSCDCSSLMAVCAEVAGINIPYNGSNAPTTSTMKNAFLSSGEFDVFTHPDYLKSDKYLKHGDILVKQGSHTVMVLENSTHKNSIDIGDLSPYPVLKMGSKGSYVLAWQNYLNSIGYNCGKADGIFGAKTLEAVKAYQCSIPNLVPDGIIGANTWNSLKI